MSKKEIPATLSHADLELFLLQLEGHRPVLAPAVPLVAEPESASTQTPNRWLKIRCLRDAGAFENVPFGKLSTHRRKQNKTTIYKSKLFLWD